MRLTNFARRLGGAIAACVLASEILLRFSGYEVSPLELLPPPAGDDVRAVYLSSKGFTRFDPGLLWKLDARLAKGDEPEPCGAPRRDAEEKRLFVLGDSSRGVPTLAVPWARQLQALLDLNAGEGPRHRVVDAGVWGYSSFQGIRRFEQVLGCRPDFAFFAFGAGDAQLVRLSDAGYAERAWRLGWLSPSRVLEAVGEATGLLRAPPATGAVPRVSRDEYRRHAREFVARARRAHVVPLLVVPDEGDASVAPYAAALREVAAADAVLLVAPTGRESLPGLDTRDRRWRGLSLAAAALDTLRTLGLVPTRRILDRAVEPGRLDVDRAELGSGFWDREVWQGDQAGRWTAAVATVTLERRAEEGGLAVEATFRHPRNDTRLRVDVGGIPVGIIEEPNGPVRRTFDVRSIPGRYLQVRLTADRPFVPGQGDPRTLGVFLRRVALLPRPVGTEILLADLPSGASELGGGWWPPEQWGDGQRGRWTQEAATIRVERHWSETRLALDLAGGHPDGHSSLRVEVNGVPVKLLRVRKTSATYVIDLPDTGETVLAVRLVAEHPFVPRVLKPGSRDDRLLGVFVRALRLEGAAS
ncbi:MAG TPA: SGNH/GDSL hydrolase family protein [Vicinamibacteria bacterium]|nr:SGNH/GDSL hydrolase family protein [Vicinamibacteria bacterium]